MKYTLIILCSIISFASCSTGPDYDHFQITVDSVAAPHEIKLGETLQYNLLGQIGMSGCSEFTYAQQVTNLNAIEITLFGKDDPNATCPATFTYLHNESENPFSRQPGKTFYTVPALRGNYTITIHQPDGSKLQKTVEIM